MAHLENAFKDALGRPGAPLLGLWASLANGYCAEICAGSGFDWMILDAEHGPNTLDSLLRQLQVMAAYPVHPVVRAPSGDPVLIKQYLEIGVQNLLVPMVDTPEQAADLVRAVSYPPRGIRGVGCGLARSSRWGRIPNYLNRAGEAICLIVQAETKTALENIEAIAATDGVDGVFIGPADLAASLGHLGDPLHPEVQSAIDTARQKVSRAGKAAGILSFSDAMARRCIDQGFTFIALGTDSVLLARACEALAGRFRPATPDKQGERN